MIFQQDIFEHQTLIFLKLTDFNNN